MPLFFSRRLLSRSSSAQSQQTHSMNPYPNAAMQGAARAEGQLGFSLIEIMVVVVIMGVLAALIVPNVMGRPDQARVVAARQDIGALMQALKLYRLDNGRYPTAEEGLQSLVGGPQAPGQPRNSRQAYMDRLPNDPWGTPYQYLNPGVHGEIDVFSLGADARAGGEGNDADIGSWSK